MYLMTKRLAKCAFSVTLPVLISYPVNATPPLSLPPPDTPSSNSVRSTSVCSYFSENPFLYQACSSEINDRPGVALIDGDSVANSVLVGTANNWLILVDGSSGSILAGDLQIKHGQRLLGVSHEGMKPSLETYQRENDNNIVLFNSAENNVSFKNLHLKDAYDDDTYHSILLRMNNSSAFSITENEFSAQKWTSAISVVCEASENTSGIGHISKNHFEVGGGQVASSGLAVDCRNDNLRVLSSDNHYKLKSGGRGVYIHTGGLKVKGDTFTQEETTSDSFDARPIGVLFNFNNYYAGYESSYYYDDGLPHRETEISCSTFNGGIHKQMLPIVLSHQVEDEEEDEGSNNVIIAHNIFKNVAEAASYSVYANITSGSICNIWEHDDESVDRCAGLQSSDFLHFTDGRHCGTVPRGYQEPDCYAARIAACGTAAPLTDNPHIPSPPPVDWSRLITATIEGCRQNCQKEYLNSVGYPALPSLTDHKQARCEQRCTEAFQGLSTKFHGRASSFYIRKPMGQTESN